MNTTPLSILALFAGAVLPAQDPDSATQSNEAAIAAKAQLSFGAYQDHDGTVRAEGQRYRAAFAPTGVEFATPAAQPTAPLPTLTLRYLGSARQGHADVATPTKAPSLADDRVRFHRDNVVETYAILANGFEQSFHFAQRPAGVGDLTLTIGVGGNVTAPAAEAGHKSLEFSVGDRRSIRYGEAIAFDRQGHRVDVLTSFDGINQITLTVPAAFIETATFPIVVDPVVTPVFIADDPTWNDNEPDVAYDIDSDVYIAVWRRVFSASSEGIRGQLFDPDGNALTGFFPFTSGGNGLSRPSVAPCNQLSASAFLVVWGQGDDIRGRLVDTTGSFLAPSFTVSSPAAGEQDEAPSVSGPGTGLMMVAWERTASGASNPNRIVMRAIRWTNPASPATPILFDEHVLQTVSSGYVERVRLARSDVRDSSAGTTSFANRAVWQQFYTTPAPGDFDMRTASFSINAANSASFTFIDTLSLVPGGASIGPNELNGDIGARATLHQVGNDIQYLIAWEDEGDVLGQMFDLSGPTGSGITIQDDANYQGLPAVGAGYCEFTVAYLETVPPAEFDVSIKAARVLLDGTVAITDRLVDDPGSEFQSDVRASSRPIHTVSEDEVNRVLLGWMGQTGPSSGLNDVRAAFFEPVDVNESPFGSPCPGPLGELASIGTTGGPAHAGNEDFGFTISGAPTGSLAVLVVSDLLTTTPIPGAPGCNLYAGLPLINIFPTITDGTGFGTVGIPMPCSIPSGTTLAFQWAIYSPTANAFGWIVSDDIDLSWSHF